MTPGRWFFVAALILGVLGAPSPGSSVTIVTITIDEQGNGVEEFPAVTIGGQDFPAETVVLKSGVGATPRAPQTLFYECGPCFTANGLGSVVLNEPGTGVSDVLFFDDVGTGGGVLFYSDPAAEQGEASSLADSQDSQTFAAALTMVLGNSSGHIVTIDEVGTEGANSAVYTPGPSDPGFFVSESGICLKVVCNPQYVIISDGSRAVPAPPSLMLLALGAGLVGAAWRRHRRK